MAMDQSNYPIDLNRALPSLPLSLDRTPKPALQPTPHVVLRDDIPTTSSVENTANTAKKQFQNITRDLMQPFVTELPPKACLPSELLDPVKYSPSETSSKTRSSQNTKMSSLSNSYGSASGLSIFSNDHRSHTAMEEFYQHRMDTPAQSFSPAEETLSSEAFQPRKGMSQSRSEGSLNYRQPPPRIRTPFEPPPPDLGQRPARMDQGYRSPSRSPIRGRGTYRTPSPTKLDDIKEGQPIEFIDAHNNEAMEPLSSPGKRSRSPMKQMFGEHGWLGRSTSMKELPSDEYRKTGIKHWGEKIKLRVNGMPRMTADFYRILPSSFITLKDSPSKSKSPPAMSSFAVSLDPPAQAKIYSEMELMICATANQYLMTQHLAGRMAVESVQKVLQYWASKNRPQVIEFQFDQSTQRDLVLYNIKTFRFYGPHAENAVSMNTMMLGWRALAKEMSVRTFCTPDSVVRKHMHDCYRILEMLGAPLITFLAFQEIQVRTLSAIRDEQARRDELQTRKFGVVRQWEPKQIKEKEEIERQMIGEEESLEDDPFPWIKKH